MNAVRKRLIWFCLAFLTGAWPLSLPAQSDSAVDGVTLKDGKLYSLRGEERELLTDKLVFPLNIKVDPKGTFKVGNGADRTLTAGQVLRRDGWLLSPDGSIQPVFDHVAMQSGRVVVMRDGQTTALTQPMVFPNNLNIAPDGLCVYPNGLRSRLVDGLMFRLDGTTIPTKDTVSLKNGRVVVQRDGALISLVPSQVMGMNDGTRVRGDGSITKPDGTTTRLREGQTILLDGVNGRP